MERFSKNTNGITLIALVVTIIVLLILAAVSLNLVAGESGILSRAEKASNVTDEATLLEKINLSLMYSRMAEGKYGKIDLGLLEEELINQGFKNEEITKSADGNLPWKITCNGFIFEIKEDGSVEKVNGISLNKTVAQSLAGIKILEPSDGNLQVMTTETGTIKVAPTNDDSEEVEYTVTSSDTSNEYIEASVSGDTITVKGKAITSSDVTLTITGTGKQTNTSKTVTATVTVTKKLISLTAEQIKASPKTYYGKEVKNYTAGGLTYRIFYVDENNKIYLKGDYETLINLNDYANYDVTNTLVRELNPEWALTRGDSESSWNINEKAAAWLCSPVNSTTVSITTLPWKNYFDSTKAEYVVGGPSVEMYVKSYNQTHDKDANGKDALGYQYQTNNAPGYGYKVYNEIQNDGWYINRNILDATTTYGNIYAGKNGEKTGSWWFVSPSANNSGHICSIDGSTANLDYDDYEHERGLSPVVLLKSGINVQVKE